MINPLSRISLISFFKSLLPSAGLGFLTILILRLIVMQFYSSTLSTFVAGFVGVCAGTYYGIVDYRSRDRRNIAKRVADNLLNSKDVRFQEIKKELKESDIPYVRDVIERYVFLLYKSGKVKTKDSKYQHMINYFSKGLISAIGIIESEEIKYLIVSKFINTVAETIGSNTRELSINTGKNSSDRRDLLTAKNTWCVLYPKNPLEVQGENRLSDVKDKRVSFKT